MFCFLFGFKGSSSRSYHCGDVHTDMRMNAMGHSSLSRIFFLGTKENPNLFIHVVDNITVAANVLVRTGTRTCEIRTGTKTYFT